MAEKGTFSDARCYACRPEAERRYANGKYSSALGTFLCTCVATCPEPCKGECGCDACHEAYGDFLSME